MIIFKLMLGILWASPVTIVNFTLHVLPCWLIGGYEFVGRKEYVLMWALKPTAPGFLKKLWKGWAGNSAGNIIVLREHPSKWASNKVIKHELIHTQQTMILGIFQPIIYILSFLAIYFSCPDLHPYKDNPFERSAKNRSQ